MDWWESTVGVASVLIRSWTPTKKRLGPLGHVHVTTTLLVPQSHMAEVLAVEKSCWLSCPGLLRSGPGWLKENGGNELKTAVGPRGKNRRISLPTARELNFTSPVWLFFPPDERTFSQTALRDAKQRIVTCGKSRPPKRANKGTKTLEKKICYTTEN